MGARCSVEEDDDLQPLRRGRTRETTRDVDAGNAYKAQDNSVRRTDLLDRVAASKEAGLQKVADRRNANVQDLLNAAMAGDVDGIRQALRARAHPDAASETVGLRALHLCATQGHARAAKVLLDAGANMDACDLSAGLSPLSFASAAGHAEVVRLLASHGAAVDGPENDGGAPLLHAARRCCVEVCSVLISSGADVNAAQRRPTADTGAAQTGANAGSTFDEFSGAASRWPYCALLSRGMAGSPARFAEAEAWPRDLAWLQVKGTTPLHFAAAHGHEQLCRALLQASARPRASDELQRTPLSLAAFSGHAEVTRCLLDYHANVSADVVGHSPGTLAARAGHTPIVRLLLQYKVMNVNEVAGGCNASMLHVAAYMGHGGTVAFLCEADADVNLSLEPCHVRPLMLAAARGHGDICQQLADYGARVNDVDSESCSAWLRAAGAGQADVCQVLASYGAQERVAAPRPAPGAAMTALPPAATMSPTSLHFAGSAGCGGWGAQQDLLRKRVQLEAENARPPVSVSVLHAARPGSGGWYYGY
eukprot:TRINITY_DN76753_c0_g1_i1.p1 TRINITY_DN76753_c0_g1~~TRINITY_DN76753_c0_g1_i1.p1  ORF type:complete len:536 (+),score=98.26 TRINITY_DN76753_c0_g1_i1:53-1660(+)